MVPATVEALEGELLKVVQTLAVFKDKAYSVFNVDDLERFTEGQTASLPIVGIGFNGSRPVRNQIDPHGKGDRGVSFVDVSFMLIIAMQYAAKGQLDTKHVATALLDATRTKLIGYKGVNTRPWRFMGEQPEPAASGEGLIFYSQTWVTSLPYAGSQTNQ